MTRESTSPVAEAILDASGCIVTADASWLALSRQLDDPDLLLCRGRPGDPYLDAAARTGGVGPAVATAVRRAVSGRGQPSQFEYLAEGSVWRVSVAPSAGRTVTIRHESLPDRAVEADQRMRSLAAMSHALLAAAGGDALLRRVVELPREHFNVARCGLLLVDGDGVRGTFGTDFTGRTTAEHGLFFAREPDSDWEGHFRRRPQLESGWDLQYGRRSYWTPRGVVLGPESWIALTPIASGGEILGFLSNDAGLTDEPYDPRLQELLAVYAAMVGGVLAQRKAETGERRSHRRIAMLHQLSAAVADCRSPADLAARVTTVLREVMPVDAFYLQAYDYAGRTAQVLAAYDTVGGEFRAVIEHEAPVSLRESPVFERLTREPGPLLVHREDGGPLFRHLDRFGDEEQPSATLAFLPIIRGDRLEGVMSAQSYQVDAYDDDAVDLLAAVASQIAPYLESLRLQDEVRQRAEALRVSEQRYRAVLKASSGVVYERDDAAGCYRFISDGIAHLTGYHAADLTPDRFEALVQEAVPVPIAETPLLDSARRLVAGERMTVSRRNLRLTTADGRALWVADTAVRVEDGEGRPRLTLGLLRDITAARQAEQERLQLAALIEQMQDAVVVADPEMRVLYVNPAFERITGFGLDEVRGQSAVSLSGLDAETVDTVTEALARNENWHGRFRRLCQNGESVPVDAIVAGVRDAAGRTTAYVGVERDLRPLEAIEERLRQTARMEAVGRLAGALAHDFNNLLTTIMGYADLLVQTLPPELPGADDALQIVAATQRASLLTQQLLALQQQRPSKPRECDAATYLEGLLPLLKIVAPPGVSVELATSGEHDLVAIDAAQIERALVDLVSWCSTAMRSAGRLVITTRRATPPAALLTEHHRTIAALEWLSVELSDDGPTLAPLQREQIFEPFLAYDGSTVTTRLGLAKAYHLVAQNGGLLECVAEPESRARFRIWLPLRGPAG